MPADFITHLEIFTGSANPAEARVYAQAALEKSHRDAMKNFQITGHLIGPQCEFAHTLPARIPFLPRSSNQTLLAEAVVPDPCFWTPELPFLYQAVLQVSDNQTSARMEENKIVGIRRLGIRGRELFFDGKRFVARGVYRNFGDRLPEFDELTFARETWTAALVVWPSSELCELASRLGLMLIADLRAATYTCNDQSISDALRRIGTWPAVIMAIVDRSDFENIKINQAARNLIVGQYVSAGDSFQIANQTQIVFAEVDELSEFAHRVKDCRRPIIAIRRLPQSVTMESARAACDALQADLAPHGDFAGYAV
jgi:hypothetical protein